MKVLLEIVSGSDKGKSLSLSDGDTIRVGRTKKADFVLTQARSLSSLHFSLTLDHETCRLLDHNSKNGTFLNGSTISEAVLADGDTIVAGEVTFSVKVVEASPETSPAPISTPSLEAVISMLESEEPSPPSRDVFSYLEPPGQTQPAVTPPTMTQVAVKKQRAMPIGSGPRQFYVELYKEHLEESSFLYEQRLTLLDDLELTWLDIGEFEERLEAHLDALVVGEALALEVCEQHAEEGDFGELFAAVCVFCRQSRWDLVTKTIDLLDSEDDERVQALTDALKYELPEQWFSQCLDYFAKGNGKFSSIIPQLVGFRRLKDGGPSFADLSENLDLQSSQGIWAFGRLGNTQKTQSLLEQHLGNIDTDMGSTSALALLRVGSPRIVSQLLTTAKTESWPLLYLALGGDESVLPLVLHRVSQTSLDGQSFVALGLLGDPSVVTSLLSHLENPEIAESVATGLNLITGADIEEDVWIPEDIDEDELFEDELQKWKDNGERPMRPDGKPFGESVVRLSQNPDDWKSWWKANQSRFMPGIRYRRGQPYSPTSLLHTLESEQSPRFVRQWAYEELTIRYGMDIAFETDMLVSQQRVAIRKMANWVEGNTNRFKPGSWYFAGKLLSP